MRAAWLTGAVRASKVRANQHAAQCAGASDASALDSRKARRKIAEMIHPSACVSADARVGAGVVIGASAIVDAGAEIGDGCVLHAHSIVRGGSVLAERVEVHPFCVVGGPPQMLRFDESLRSGVRVGARTILREGVTLNRSTRPDGWTVIGADCFLMANSHVAHDCALADRVVLANGALLAGHCEVGAGSFLGGGAAVHQFTRIGENVMVGGLARITKDLPHFLLVAERDEVSGLNVVGLRRRGCNRAVVVELKTLFRRVYGAPNVRAEAAAALAEGAATTDEGRLFLAFFAAGKRGVARPGRAPEKDATQDEEGA
jgi:UDP-N-acetylglucosamine acyltransferase